MILGLCVISQAGPGWVRKVDALPNRTGDVVQAKNDCYQLRSGARSLQVIASSNRLIFLLLSFLEPVFFHRCKFIHVCLFGIKTLNASGRLYTAVSHSATSSAIATPFCCYRLRYNSGTCIYHPHLGRGQLRADRIVFGEPIAKARSYPSFPGNVRKRIERA